LKHFGAQMNHEQTQIHKTPHSPHLGEATTFPLIVYYAPNHGTNTQMSFCLKTLKIFKVRTLSTLGANNFVCKLLIEMKCKTKL